MNTQENERTIEPSKIIAEQMALLNEASKKQGTTAKELAELSLAMVKIYEAICGC